MYGLTGLTVDFRGPVQQENAFGMRLRFATHYYFKLLLQRAGLVPFLFV